MAMDSKRKVFSYRGGMSLLLALLILLLVGGVIAHRYSFITRISGYEHFDEGLFYGIVGVALLASVLAIVLSIRFNRNMRTLKRVAKAMEEGADVEEVKDFANDELGDLSRHLIDLYKRLRQASNDVEVEHDRALHEEQEKLRIKRQLTNNINHELKTPVAAIQGYLETMIANPVMTDEERRTFIEKCYANSQRLTQLLTDVSTITRLEDGSSHIECDSVDLRGIIDEIAAEVALLPVERQMRMNINLPSPMLVKGNSSLLMSMFKNLTDNALAYSAGRDIFINIESVDDKFYTLTFADNGIGVDEDHINHLFERFYRIDKGRSRKLGGTGLGLSIVKNAVLFHGGDISIANRRTGGLEFRITLPRA
jgi:signal transduction histidine kinase